MKKITNKEDLAAILFENTIRYSDTYIKVNKKKTIDKQLWAALHIGFGGGLMSQGFSEKETEEIIDLSIIKLEKAGF